MYSVRQTVALLLLALGGFLILLGATGTFIQPPSDVSPETNAQMKAFSLIGGVIGLGLFAWGVYLRATLSRGGKWLLWVVYFLFLVVFIGLTAFAWAEVSPLIGSIAAEGDVGSMIGSGVFFLMFLFGPIILFFRQLLSGREDEEKKSGGPLKRANSA